MFALKNYQQRAVDTLEHFLLGCQVTGSVTDAYDAALKSQGMPELAYRDHGFEQVPYVCLRIPTGGGKTVLGSYAIDIAARKYLNTTAPITLWLVPTNTIRLQTVAALKTAGHPYRERLDAAFNRQVLVLDIDDVTQIRAQDVGSKAIVVVSTLANLRVSDTSGRRVYAYNEDFEPHFTKLSAHHPAMARLERVTEADIKENGLSPRAIGSVKYSFANLLALHQPLVIVDEAHNARTSLTFDTLRRVHPAAVIELTATPNTTNTNGSNVLFHVSAAELKAEEMIKLPIMLSEHQNWQDAIRDAVITRNKLAMDAQKDTDYIRPIALFQAEPKNGDVTVEVLKQYLVETLNIEAKAIAIATGSQRELDGLNLFAPDCPIEYIITIEALKEGWDCSFAYVFCSVKQVSSSKDVEQLLGRVLRMPYARRRVIEDLNRAYAHLASPKFAHAAQELTDKLIAMGFEEMEVAAFLKQQSAAHTQDDLFEGDEDDTERLIRPQLVTPAVVFELPKAPDTSVLSDSERAQVVMSEDRDGNTVVKVTGEVSEAIQTVLSQGMTRQADREKLARDVRVHNLAIQAARAPSENGQRFGSLPLLCMEYQAQLELVEPELLLHAHGWNLLDYPAELPSFRLEETTKSFSIDLDGQQISYRVAGEKEVIPLNQGFLETTENDLVRWLDRQLKQPDILQQQMLPFVARLVNSLLQQPTLSLTALVRNQFQLARAIGDLIKLHRRKAQKQGYQLSVFAEGSAVCLSDQFVYSFNPEQYPSRPPYYSGRYKFQKHYFPQSLIEDLKATGEEYECAKAIDGLTEVEFWIRNLVRRDQASFWLPLAHGNFYPDFVCQLTDGRMLVVEYKGEAYASNYDSAEKRAIGHRWAELSGGQCLFLMAVEQDSQGRDVRQQILDVIQLEAVRD
ncbi:DEAD/DEAH box helicase family protein [Endozoicomonas atrinae]|uniref:DEAD/DEAH box helicase family protein n=1 Tax=Endozoicomonas atrinae TaxID=1333660 RepID=UPI0008261C03|nr:DEAD/DEAH box helicase family protein [Endozoicomonas atrinae]